MNAGTGKLRGRAECAAFTQPANLPQSQAEDSAQKGEGEGAPGCAKALLLPSPRPQAYLPAILIWPALKA